MTPLLAITAVLLVGSGLLKLRAAERAKLGIHLLSIIELLVGLGIGALLMAGGLTVAVGFRTLLGALTLVLVSSVSLGTKLRAVRRRKNLSEGARLFNYVDYLSQESSQDEQLTCPQVWYHSLC